MDDLREALREVADAAVHAGHGTAGEFASKAYADALADAETIITATLDEIAALRARVAELERERDAALADAGRLAALLAKADASVYADLWVAQRSREPLPLTVEHLTNLRAEIAAALAGRPS